MKGLLILSLLVVVSTLITPPQSAAQQSPAPLVFTYVTQWTVPRAQWPEVDKKVVDVLKPTMDRLIDEGTLTGYAFYENLARDETSSTHGNWIEASSIGGILKALAAIQPQTLANPILENSKEQEEFLRAAVFSTKSGTFENGYLWVGSFPMKAGHNGEWNQVFGNVIRPVLDKLVADNALAGYRYEATLIHHSEGNWMTYVYFGLNPDSIDRMETAMRGAVGSNTGAAALVDANMRDEGISNTLARIIVMRQK